MRRKPSRTKPRRPRHPASRRAGIKKPQGTPSRQLLGSLLTYYDVNLSPAQLDRLWDYHRLLLEHNQDSDLTRLHSFDSIVQRHYADCMLVHWLVKRPWPSPLLDLGTGAGFPGIMLKIISPGTRLFLAEPRPRRAEFLELVIRTLGLKKISVFNHKVTSDSFTKPVKGCITRAFASMQNTLPRLENCLEYGGLAYFMKGPGVRQELKVPLPKGYRIEKRKYYAIPHSAQKRALIVVRRYG
jgi:16S rRNA (guanine527-N7)-methyltransferase